jgi:hypothetical protein
MKVRSWLAVFGLAGVVLLGTMPVHANPTGNCDPGTACYQVLQFVEGLPAEIEHIKDVVCPDPSHACGQDVGAIVMGLYREVLDDLDPAFSAYRGALEEANPYLDQVVSQTGPYVRDMWNTVGPLVGDYGQAAGPFGDCLAGGGVVSSWREEGHWVHYCQGGTNDGDSWMT